MRGLLPTPCQYLIFLTAEMPLVEILSEEKVYILSKGVQKHYVNTFCILSTFELWKTPVEKSVENVEKFRFSTDKPGVYTTRATLSPCI